MDSTCNKNNDIIKMLTFHTTKSKKFGRKLLLILERAITFIGLEMPNFLKNCFKKRF